MKRGAIGGIALAETVLVTVWLVLLLAGIARDGTITTFEQALGQAARQDALFCLSYVNAALLTVGAVLLFAGLYVTFSGAASATSVMAVVFVPIYGVLNLVVYLSQVTVVPRLVTLYQQADSPAVAGMLLRQMLQQLPDSAILAVNVLAYAVLGIPSVIFGILLLRGATARKAAGALLALNGVVAILGFVGVVARSSALAFAGAAGSGLLFWLALFPLTWSFLRDGGTRTAGAIDR